MHDVKSFNYLIAACIIMISVGLCHNLFLSCVMPIPVPSSPLLCLAFVSHLNYQSMRNGDGGKSCSSQHYIVLWEICTGVFWIKFVMPYTTEINLGMA